MTNERDKWTRRLRLVLRANAAFSLVGGLVAVVAAGWVSKTLGIDHTVATALLGGGLVAFAAGVWWTSTQPDEQVIEGAGLISLADAAWVLASAVVVGLGFLSTAGVVVTVAVAVAVADFGITQWWMRRNAVRDNESRDRGIAYA